jgi:hypothetical protein
MNFKHYLQAWTLISKGQNPRKIYQKYVKIEQTYKLCKILWALEQNKQSFQSK